jgi:hypothetical protein
VALQKQPIPINFAKGLDTKSDPYQLSMDTFLVMQNSVFTTTGRITKRNGFTNVTTVPNKIQTTLTTINDNLVATGSNLYALSQDTSQWLNQGIVQPISISTLPLVRNSYSQTSQDMAVSSLGLACLVFIQNGVAYFQISDSSTGQQIVKQTSLLSIDTGSSAIVAPRVFVVGNYFYITYLATVSGQSQLRYIPISMANPNTATSSQLISSTVYSTTSGYNAAVLNNTLYVAWCSSASVISVTYIIGFSVQVPTTITGHTATYMSVTIDQYDSITPIIWVSFWDSTSTNGYTASFSQSLVLLSGPTQIITGMSLNAFTAVAANGKLSFFYEVANTYASPYPVTGVKTDYIVANTLTGTTLGTPKVILRSVGLASKAFINYVYTLPSAPRAQVSGPTLPTGATLISSTIYMFATYGEINTDTNNGAPDQPTYFLIDSAGNIYSRQAYSNGGGYTTTQVLPSVSYENGSYFFPYLFADLLVTVNKGTNNGIPQNSIYTQTGVSLAQFQINAEAQQSSEIGGSLYLTGGQLWQYDGVKPVEQGFQVWPDNVQAVWSATGGSMAAIPVSGGSNTNAYYYQFCYEWTDAQGVIQRSAPSIPFAVTTTGSGTTGSVTLYVPTLRLTYKIAPNPVRIVGYRWSQGQQVYYEFTSVTSPTINDPTIDFVTITDTQADSNILGNTIIYTTGGVVEDIAAPPCIDSCLFNDRLFLIDAEDQNLLWYSKQVIEATTVEMSDLLTIFVAPTLGAQGSTGFMTALSAMDDKLIIFKKDAIYYINGTGPDNTGANSTYSDPTFITASVGCANPKSIVLMPNGLMFQSDKGIWLLGRDLSTNYIGAPVEIYNSQTVNSSETIPGTNQVRFILDNNMTLVYDYYFNQWSTFTNIQAISSCLWQGYQTYLNTQGQVFQETPGTYVDGSSPVLVSLTSAWMNLAGLQGYERFYFMYLLGTYYSPFKLNVQFAYDYNPSSLQNVIVSPDNQAQPWGGEANWGSGTPWGASADGGVFRARIFPQKQKCESFQISINEIYDASYAQPPGQGLTLSGMNIVAGVKKGYRPSTAARSFG